MAFRLSNDVRDRRHICQTLIANQIFANNITGNTSGRILVFRPGYTGTDKTIYSDWNELYQACLQTQSYKIVYFDDSDSSLNIPPSPTPYDMTDTVWTTIITSSSLNLSFIPVIIPEGCTLKNLYSIEGLLRLIYQGTSQPCMVYDPLGIEPPVQNTTNSSILFLDKGASIVCTGSQEFLRIVSGVYTSILGIGGVIIQGNYQVFNIVTGGTSFQISLIGYGSRLEDNTVRGSGVFVIDYANLTAQCSDLPSSQPLITGTYTFTNQINTSRIPYSNITYFASDPKDIATALDRIASVLFVNFGPIPPP